MIFTKVDTARSAEAWQEKVFDLLLCQEKIVEDVVRSMRGWPGNLGLPETYLLDSFAHGKITFPVNQQPHWRSRLLRGVRDAII